MKTSFEENTFGERFLRSLNGDVFDEAPAREIIDRHFDRDFAESDQLFVVVGSDSGLLIDYFRSLELGLATRVLIVEPDEIVDLIAAERNLPDSESPVRLLRESEWEAAFGEHSVVKYVHGGKLIMLLSLAAFHANDERYGPLALSVRRTLTQRAHDAKVRVNNRVFIERQLANAADNIHSAGLLRGRGKGHTAVVLGGGPSLDEHLPWIVEHQEQLTLIAVSRLSAKLQQAGIRPDIVVSVDPQAGMYEISKAGLHWDDVLLINHFHVVPELLQQWRGPCLYLSHQLPWGSPVKGTTEIIAGTGPTVSHAANWLAFELGFEQILLSGVDLCFAADGTTHATGSIEARLGAMPTDMDMEVVTYSGRVASTNVQMNMSIESLKSQASHITGAGVALVNLSAEAAAIENVLQLPCEQITLPASKADLTLELSDEKHFEYLQALRHDLHRAAKELTSMSKRCKQAKGYIDRLHGLGGHRADYAYKGKLDHLEAGLEKNHSDLLETAKAYSGAELTSLCNPSGFEEMDEQTIADWGKDYYRILGDTARSLGKRVKDTIEIIDWREHEFRTTPDIPSLMAFWEQSGTQGRAWHMLHRHGDAVDPANQERLQGMLDAFNASIDEQETDFERRVRENNTDTAMLLARLQRLFDTGNCAMLKGAAERLLAREAQLALLGQVASGYLAELQDQRPAALIHYGKVIEEISLQLESDGELDADHSKLLEPAMLRIAHVNLDLGQFAEAIEALGILTQHDMAHAPMYARLLSSQGYLSEALEILSIYLEAFPDDWRSHEAVAVLYRQLDQADAASEASARATTARECAALQRAA